MSKRKLWQAHIQQRVRPALLIAVGAFVGHKAHVLVKADGLRVLLVDCDLPNAVVFHAVFQQPPADARHRAARLSNRIRHLPPLVNPAALHRSTAVCAWSGPILQNSPSFYYLEIRAGYFATAKVYCY